MATSEAQKAKNNAKMRDWRRRNPEKLAAIQHRAYLKKTKLPHAVGVIHD